MKKWDYDKALLMDNVSKWLLHIEALKICFL